MILKARNLMRMQMKFIKNYKLPLQVYQIIGKAAFAIGEI